MALVRGATDVRKIIIDYFENDFPALLVQAREEWNLDQYQLPDIASYKQYDVNILNEWPAICVNIARVTGFARVDVDATATQQYMPKYTVMLYTWVRTPFDENDLPPVSEVYETTMKLREDLTALVRTHLLRRASLGNVAVIWNESTLTEEYGEPMQVKGGRYIAGTMHTFTLQYDESTALAPIGNADTIDTGMGLL